MFLSVCGCAKVPPKPEGIPELFPCSVHVTFGKQKMDAVSVLLTPEDKASKWSASGLTDTEGTAEMKTGAFYAGVPEGKYRISFSKTVNQEGTRPNKLPKPPLSVIPLKYAQGKSNLTVDINRQKSVYPFELESGQSELW